LAFIFKSPALKDRTQLFSIGKKDGLELDWKYVFLFDSSSSLCACSVVRVFCPAATGPLSLSLSLSLYLSLSFSLSLSLSLSLPFCVRLDTSFYISRPLAEMRRDRWTDKLLCCRRRRLSMQDKSTPCNGREDKRRSASSQGWRNSTKI
jgi:hypothetical protein